MADLLSGGGALRPLQRAGRAPGALRQASAGTQAHELERCGKASLDSAARPSEVSDRVDDDCAERELLRRISCADREAFRDLYLDYHGRLARFLSRITRHHGDVEEIINDVLLIVWESAGDFRGASRVSTWIFGIAYRRALNSMRRSTARSRATTRAAESAETHVEDAAGRTEDHQVLDLALSCLPPEQRLVVILAYRLEYSCEEIAAIAACPVNTVKSRMCHARRKLRTIISAAATGPGT
jgi:RNA polymerase sigma-70 factor (ECF subfamily)